VAAPLGFAAGSFAAIGLGLWRGDLAHHEAILVCLGLSAVFGALAWQAWRNGS
jgi:succinate-acetate transporter protein